jgi:hypothetical protein
MNKFRMALTGLALTGFALAAGLLIPAGVAQAATSAPAVHQLAADTPTLETLGPQVITVPGTSCAEIFTPSLSSVSGDPVPAYNFAEAFWDTNSCGLQGRIHIKCEFGDGSTHDYDGGWVTSIGLNDAASCPAGSVLIGAAWQSRGGPGQTVNTDWFLRLF